MENLKQLRLDRNLTQKELAEILGVYSQCILNWENGITSPHINMIIKIADFFGVSIDYLVGRNNYDMGVDYAVKIVSSFTEEELHKLFMNKVKSN